MKMIDKYLNFVRELKKLRNMKVITVFSFGTVSKDLKKRGVELETKCQIQLRRVLKTYCPVG